VTRQKGDGGWKWGLFVTRIKTLCIWLWVHSRLRARHLRYVVIVSTWQDTGARDLNETEKRLMPQNSHVASSFQTK